MIATTFFRRGLWGFTVTAYLPTTGMTTLVQDWGFSHADAVKLGQSAMADLISLAAEEGEIR